jgi:hypothetical protein
MSITMAKEEISTYLAQLNDELAAEEVTGEICLYGGAVMCLVFDARPATRDVDAVFKPANTVRLAAFTVAEKNGLPLEWLNDAVMAFTSEHEQTRILAEFSHLTIYYAEPRYLLAMKALAARADLDRKDMEFLVKHLGITTAAEVFAIIEEFYPKRNIKPATQFAVEELFEQ